jgi:hypothetical protein
MTEPSAKSTRQDVPTWPPWLRYVYQRLPEPRREADAHRANGDETETADATAETTA